MQSSFGTQKWVKTISPSRGIEPRSPAWQAGILTTILTRIAEKLSRADKRNSALALSLQLHCYTRFWTAALLSLLHAHSAQVYSSYARKKGWYFELNLAYSSNIHGAKNGMHWRKKTYNIYFSLYWVLVTCIFVVM